MSCPFYQFNQCLQGMKTIAHGDKTSGIIPARSIAASSAETPHAGLLRPSVRKALRPKRPVNTRLR